MRFNTAGKQLFFASRDLVLRTLEITQCLIVNNENKQDCHETISSRLNNHCGIFPCDMIQHDRSESTDVIYWYVPRRPVVVLDQLFVLAHDME